MSQCPQRPHDQTTMPDERPIEGTGGDAWMLFIASLAMLLLLRMA